MSAILQFLLVAALIAGMMLFRMLVDRLVARSRLRGRIKDAECVDTGCHGGCGGKAADAVSASVAERNN